MTRRWDGYIKRAFEEFDNTKKAASGASAVIGGMVGGPFGAVIGGTGASVVFFGWCLIKSIPKKLKDASLSVGACIKIEDIDDYHPNLVRIGCIGVSKVGKTTLQLNVAQIPVTEISRTESLYARISVLPSSPPKIYALIDGAGQEFSQQFSIFDECKIVIVCLDHNIDAFATAIDRTRMASQTDFLAQVRGHLLRTNKLPERIHFLMNKNDNWSKEPDSVYLVSWFNSIVRDWKNLPNTIVTSDEHSNLVTADMVRLTNKLASWMEQ